MWDTCGQCGGEFRQYRFRSVKLPPSLFSKSRMFKFWTKGWRCGVCHAGYLIDDNGVVYAIPYVKTKNKRFHPRPLTMENSNQLRLL